MTSPPPLLSTQGLSAGYGDFQALHSVDFVVDAGEIVALIGANGAGKSTLLKAIVGLIRVAPEMVRFEGGPVGGQAPYALVRRGIAMVPEGRRLFAGMSVEDNLKVAIDHAATGERQGGKFWSSRCAVRSLSRPAGTPTCASGSAFRRTATDGRHRPRAVDPTARAALR